MKLRTILLILVFLSLASISTGGYLYYVSIRESSLEQAHREGMTRTQLIADHIDSFLSERQKTVKAFAGLKELRQALADKNESKILEANMILDHFQQALNVDVCYLMDEQGNTVASSNRNAPDSFIGKNYAFRPYFQEAKQGNPAVYMALGATSGKRGVYFSHPVYGELNKLPSGVLVVKDSNQATEKEIRHGFEGVMLFTDPHGVIFVSSREDWLFQVVWRVLPDEIAKIVKTRQFGDGPLKWTGLEKESETHAIDKSGIEYDIHQTEIKNYPGWKVVYLNDSRSMMNRVSGPLFRTAGLIILISCLIVGLAVLFLYRGAANVIVLQKKAEKERQKEKEFSDSLVNSLPGVFYLFDEKKLRFRRWNHNFENVTGYSSSELAGMSPLELFDEYEGARVAERIGQVFEKGYATVEAALLTKKGDRIPYFFTGHALKTDEEIYLIGMGIDISERKKVEENLMESEERFRSLFERSLELVYLCDFEGNFIDANDAALELFGYTKKDIKSLNFMALLEKDQLPRAFEVVEELLKTGSQRDIAEFQLKRKDGEHIYVESMGSLVYRDGKPFAIQGIARNITERKKLEEEREKLIHQLENALAEVKTLGGLLPICAHCKKIRDDKGYWNQIEAYIHKHSGAEFSHGICPECMKKYYPEYDDKSS